MGHRAHYVIVQDGSWDLYHSQWGANDLDLDLLPGPDFALRFMSSQRLLSGRDLVWTNELMCEAAAIVVPREKRLGFYLINHHGIVSRAAMLDVLALTWPGWRIEWLYQGLPDVLTRLGEDVSKVHVDVSPYLQRLCPAGRYRGCLVTVAENGATRAYALSNVPFEVVGRGEKLLSTLPDEALTTSLRLTPDSGVHLDVAGRQAWLWSIDPLYRVLEWANTSWPGWTWTFLADDWATHLALAGDAVRFPPMERGFALTKLQVRLGRHAACHPADDAIRVLTAVLGPGPEACDHHMAMPEEGEYATVLTAIAALRREA